MLDYFYKDELPLYGTTRREDKFKKRCCYCGLVMMWGATSFLSFALGYHYRNLSCTDNSSLMDEL